MCGVSSEGHMKSARWLCLMLSLALVVSAAAQTRITIPAGTPEDKALTDISAESDAQKRTAMLEEFVKTYSGNPAAVAYGDWQLSQQFISTDPAKALDYGDKALAAMPDVVDILQSQADVAQQLKNYAKVVDYSVRAAVVINSLDKRPKPEGMSDQDFASQIAQEKAGFQNAYQYLQTTGYNAILSESDPKKRLEEIDRYTEAYKGSQFADDASAMAIATLQEMNDMPRLVAYGEKVLASSPNNVRVMTVLANALAEDQQATNLPKAAAYAKKVIELIQADQAAADQNKKITEGFAYQILGYTLLREEKTPAAVTELKTASSMLKDDPAKYSITLYRLGFAYAKLNKVAEAKEVLTEAVNVPGPFQEPAKDLLKKVSAARPARRTK